MEIQTGLFEHMVLQRTARNVSDAAISGKCGVAGTVEARVTQSGRAVRGFNWRVIGRAARKRFTGRVKGLGSGGPYDIELRIRGGDRAAVEALTVGDVLVGDVWVAAGQSNMFGCGRRHHALRSVPQVRAFYMNDHWAAAKDPIHNMWDAVDQVHADLKDGKLPTREAMAKHGVGPAVAFGQEMHRLTGIPQGLLACAHGGVPMTQWDPKLKKLGGKSLYGATCRRIRKNGGRIAGVVWYQGESDTNPDAAPLYTDRMKALVRAFRRVVCSPCLPFVAVQIGRVVCPGISTPAWNSIQDQQRRLTGAIRNYAVVPTIDLDLDDLAHIGGADQHRLGRRLANAMHALIAGRKGGKLPVDVADVRVERDPHSGTCDIVVEFANVIGSLRAGGRPTGFSICAPDPQPVLYRVDLDDSRARLKTSAPMVTLDDHLLCYGYGPDPYCNITDEADRAVPAFGPLPIVKPRAITPFLRNPRVSDLLPSAGKLQRLAYPKNRRALKLKPRAFAQSLCDRHLELAAIAPRDVVVYYAFDFECHEAMKLAASLGYDGPVKMWVDGRKVFHDPNGTNPACPDASMVPFSARRGRHEILIALGSNQGSAWGVFLRIERSGVPARLIRKGPDHWGLPRIITT